MSNQDHVPAGFTRQHAQTQKEHDAVHTRYMLHGAGLSSNTACVLCTPWGNIPQCANESTPIRAGRITHANPTRRLIYCPISSPWLHLFGQIPTDFQEEASQAFRIMSSLQAVLYKINQKSLKRSHRMAHFTPHRIAVDRNETHACRTTRPNTLAYQSPRRLFQVT